MFTKVKGDGSDQASEWLKGGFGTEEVVPWISKHQQINCAPSAPRSVLHEA